MQDHTGLVIDVSIKSRKAAVSFRLVRTGSHKDQLGLNGSASK
ncbi:hypothetical protein [Enterococcus sp. BWT-B8]|nr:hypothetical protein [Enterococcus sp. BWT-B8]